ncbi:MAG: GAP family protein [bacterium]
MLNLKQNKNSQKIKKIFTIVFFAIIIIGLFFLYSNIFNFHIPNIKTYKGFLPLLIMLAAIIDSVSPCAFSVLFLTITFLFSLGRKRKEILFAGIAFIFGIFATYVLIGLGFLKALSLFNIPNLMSKFGAIAIIIFGLIMLINEFFPNFPIKLKIPKFAHRRIAILVEKATLHTSFALGIVVGLFEFPCTGGPYLFILGLLHDQRNILKGFVYLLFYNFIFVLPLLIVLFIAINKKVLSAIDNIRKVETKKARLWIAFIMIILGLLVFVIN